MSSTVFSEASAQQVALAHLSRRHPSLQLTSSSVLKLAGAWLVLADATGLQPSDHSERLLVIVNRYGFVEEVGTSAGLRPEDRCLEGLRKVNEIIDLRESPVPDPAAVNLRPRRRDAWS